jgi:hypothetical protein
MANAFKIKTKAGGAVAADTDMTVYTVPAGTTAVIIGLTIDVKVESNTVDTETNTNVNIGQNLPIPSGSSLDALAGKVVLQTTDVLKIQSDTANSIDIALSVMEIT